MGKRRGLKLKFFKASHIKRLCEERDSRSYQDFILILIFFDSFSFLSMYSIIKRCLWAELLLDDSKQSVWERPSSYTLLELLRSDMSAFLGLDEG